MKKDLLLFQFTECRVTAALQDFAHQSCPTAAPLSFTSKSNEGQQLFSSLFLYNIH
jgi:hypothetical protein